MSTLTEAKTLGDLLKYEAPNLYSRDSGIVAAGQRLALGTVLGRETANGRLRALNPAATNGTQTAVAVLAQPVDADLAEAPAVIVARHAIVAQGALVWPAGITAPQRASAEAALIALGILPRTSA